MSDPELLALRRQGERWLFAAKQDQHPVVKLLHLNYAVCTFDLAFRKSGSRPDRSALEAAQRDQDRLQRELLARFSSRYIGAL